VRRFAYFGENGLIQDRRWEVGHSWEGVPPLPVGGRWFPPCPGRGEGGQRPVPCRFNVGTGGLEKR
jgi:hypothetical protein